MKYLAILVLFISSQSYGDEKFSKEIHGYLGMAIVNYTENEKTIEGENVQDPAAGSVAQISSSIQYTFINDFKKSFYVTTTFPLLPSAEGTYISAGVGMEYYFNDIASKVGLYNSGTSITFTPTFRYFAGAEIGGGYLVYNTETATKSDAIFELGVNGGLSYAFSDQYSLKTQIAVLKGTGVVTSSMVAKVLVGLTIFLD